MRILWADLAKARRDLIRHQRARRWPVFNPTLVPPPVLALFVLEVCRDNQSKWHRLSCAQALLPRG